MNLMGDSIEDLDKKTEQKDNKKDFSEIKIGLPDFNFIGEMNEPGFNKISSKIKSDRPLDRFYSSLNNHKYIKRKKQ